MYTILCLPRSALAFSKMLYLAICMKALFFFACCFKTFDLVNHNILYSRLPSKGFHAYWFWSLLFSRGTRNKLCMFGGDLLSQTFLYSKWCVSRGCCLLSCLLCTLIDDLMCLKGSRCWPCFKTVSLLMPSSMLMAYFCLCILYQHWWLRFVAVRTLLPVMAHSPSFVVISRFVVNRYSYFIDTASFRSHLGHPLNHNLSDAPDINHKLHDMVREAMLLLPLSWSVHFYQVVSSYCLSLNS